MHAHERNEKNHKRYNYSATSAIITPHSLSSCRPLEAITDGTLPAPVDVNEYVLVGNNRLLPKQVIQLHTSFGAVAPPHRAPRRTNATNQMHPDNSVCGLVFTFTSASTSARHKTNHVYPGRQETNKQKRHRLKGEKTRAVTQ